MKTELIISTSDSNKFCEQCKSYDLPYKLISADKQYYTYELEFLYPFQLFNLGFSLGLKVSADIFVKPV